MYSQRGLGALGLKEIAQHFSAFIRQHAAGDFGPMIESPVPHEVPHRTHRTGFLVERAKDEMGDACPNERASAHRTWLESHDQGAIVEPPRAQGCGSITQCDDLGMPARVAVTFANVSALANDLSRDVEHDRTDRYIPIGHCFLGEGQGATHWFSERQPTISAS